MDNPTNRIFSKWKEEAIKKRVAVIGGGVAGLSAIKTLFEKGIRNVILLEAQETLGGRVKTVRYNDSLILEDGAQWIHGGRGNSIFHIAQQLNQLNSDDLPTEFNIVNEAGRRMKEDQDTAVKVTGMLEDAMVNGELINYYGQSYGQYFIDRFRNEISFGNESPNLRAWLHFLEQRVNGEEGTASWNHMSARDADQYVNYGDDYLWKNGYDSIVTYLTQDIPSSTYLTRSPVSKIYWRFDNDPRVLLLTSNGAKYLVDFVISTTSIGYLKKNHQQLFYPSLPEELVANFEGIELGDANKILIAWTDCWWGKGYFQDYILWTKFDLPAEMQWLYGIVDIFQLTPGKPELGAFVTGTYSHQMEALNENTVKEHFVTFLKKLHCQIHIPEPKAFRRTSWNGNLWTCGSYSSYITTKGDEMGLRSRAPFRRPLTNRNNENVLFWAGEHTHDSRPGTVDGAFDSGQREAYRVGCQISTSNSDAI